MGPVISEDGGDTWKVINKGIEGAWVYSIEFFNDILFIGTDTGIYRSFDNGENWEEMKIPKVSQVFSIRTHPDSLIFIATNTGLFVSDDDGDSWRDITLNLNAPIAVRDISESPKMGLAILSEQNEIFFKSDSDNTWINITKELPAGTVNTIHLSYLGNLYAGKNGGVYKFNFSAMQWENVCKIELWGIGDTEHPGQRVEAILEKPGNSLFIGTSFSPSFLISRDQNIWHQKSTRRISSLAMNSKGWVFAGAEGEVYRTKDNGTTWQEVRKNMLWGHHRGLAIDRQDIIYTSVSGKVYRSIDDGENWQFLSDLGKPVDNLIDMCIDEDNSIYVAKWNDLVFCSNNNGETWNTSIVDQCLRINSLVCHNGKEVLAGTGKGLYRAKTHSTNIEMIKDRNDGIKVAIGNYPNPFNPKTTINYALPTTGHLSIKVYNLTGRVVKVLINSHQQAGIHSITWDGVDIHGHQEAAGVYIYQIVFTTKDDRKWVQSKKMCLVR